MCGQVSPILNHRSSRLYFDAPRRQAGIIHDEVDPPMIWRDYNYPPTWRFVAVHVKSGCIV